MTGSQWTRHDVVMLIEKMIFLPIVNQIESDSYLLYDAACDTGA